MILLGILFCLWFCIAFYKSCLCIKLKLEKFDLINTLPLSAILCLCVMMCHLSAYFSDKQEFWRQFGCWGGLAVSVFFFKAGYGLNYSLAYKGRDYLKGFMRKRFSKLVLPVFCVTFFWQIYIYSEGKTIIQYAHEFLLHGITFSPYAWFVYVICMFYIVWWVINFSIKHKTVANILMLVFVALYCFITKKANWGGEYRLGVWAFPIGLFFQSYEEKIRLRIMVHKIKFLFVLLFISILLFGYAISGEVGLKCPGWWDLLANMLPLIIVGLIYFTGFFQSKVLRLLGEVSYEFYIIHGCLIAMFVKYSKTYIEHPVFFIFIVVISSLIGAIMLKNLCGIIKKCFNECR